MLELKEWYKVEMLKVHKDKLTLVEDLPKDRKESWN